MAYFLGRLTKGGDRTSYFLGKGGAVVQSTSTMNGSVVQAFKRLVLREANFRKGVPLAELETVLSTHGGILELSTGRPDEDLGRKLEPLKNPKRGILEVALKRVEDDLARAEREYLQWKGVRNLDEAHYNLTKRQEEIADLNQKLYHNSLEPQFVYNPGHPLRKGLSAWQTNERVHFRELKDQAKERASAVRLRIDFTRRKSILDLKRKKKELTEELEAERKREKAYEKSIASIVESNLALSVSMLVRSKIVRIQGRASAAVELCEADAIETAARLRRALKERLGLEFSDAPVATGLVDPTSLSRALAPAEDSQEKIGRMAQHLLSRSQSRPRPPEIRFPAYAPGKRMAYLGLACAEDQSSTRVPVLYDLDALSRHVLIVGGTGSGKSQLGRVLVESLLLQEPAIPVLIIDPTNSWTGLMEPCQSKSMLERYPTFAMRTEWARGFDAQLVDTKKDAQEAARSILSFAGASILLTSTLSPSGEIESVRGILQALRAEIQSWPERPTRFAIVMDEAHKFLADKGLNEEAQLLARTARVKGAALVFISQNWTDVGEIRSNCQTKAQLATGYGPDLTRASQVFSSKYRTLVPKLRQGCALVNYPEWGTALVQVRPALSSPAAVSTAALEIQTAASSLSEVAAALARRVATRDTPAVEDADSWENTAGQAQSGETANTTKNVATPAATDWRDVATRFNGTQVSASTILAAIKKAGVEPPSLRTIQRYMTSRKRNDPDFRYKSSRPLLLEKGGQT